MHVDARTLEDGTLIEGDICIIGAGAAGISMAMEWMNTPYKVILLEGGGFEYDAGVQDLYRGENIGRKYHPFEHSRLHFFGGTTNHWGGFCSPFDAIDFEKRDWVPYSGWPINREDLDVYYGRANKWIELGPNEYDVAYWEENHPGHNRLPFDESRVWTKMWQLSAPLRFGKRYRKEIEQSPNIHLYTYANVCAINANEGVSSIEELDIKSHNGNVHRVKARHYVLACGAVQNARLLLASNHQVSAGLGNDNDLVGRFFMDHPEVKSAYISFPKGRGLDLYMFAQNYMTIKAHGELALSPELQKEHRVLNGTAGFREPVTDLVAYEPTGGTFDMFENPEASLTWIDNAVKYVYSGNAKIDTENFETFVLLTRLEQAPDPNSRIVLSNEKDALGVPRIKVDWQLGELEKRSIRTLYEVIGEEAGRNGIGRIKLMDWLLDDDTTWPSILGSGWHQMGTTRMHSDPKQGVVDANCKVHGLENLFVAGSGAFTTGGAANPTLTIVALTIRLSDHLKEKMG